MEHRTFSQLRDDKIVAPQKLKAIEARSTKLTIRAAAEAAGVDRNTIHRWMREDPAFKQAMDDAQQDALDRIEEQRYEQAKGKSMADAALLLNAHRSELYRPKDKNVGLGEGGVTVEIIFKDAKPTGSK